MSTNESDLKSFATSTNVDFYALLNLQPGASETEISSAYRKTARQYHPDKLKTILQNPTQSDLEAAAEKFHLVQTANSILSDASLREIYDHARRAREAKKAREETLSGRRKEMVQELERAEKEADRVRKRKREGFDVGGDEGEDEAKEREMRRLAEEGRRMRKEFEEKRRREAEAEEEAERLQQEREEQGTKATAPNGYGSTNSSSEVSDIDRSITLRWLQASHTPPLDKTSLIQQFSCFGAIEGATLRDKKIKKHPEDKHRSLYTIAVIVFESIVGAHAVVSDFHTLAKSDPAMWSQFEEVGWAGGKEPDAVPKPPGASQNGNEAGSNGIATGHAATALPNGERAGSNGTPKFSFKKPGTSIGPNLDDTLMMRLKNAEKRRLEKKMKDQEESLDS